MFSIPRQLAAAMRAGRRRPDDRLVAAAGGRCRRSGSCRSMAPNAAATARTAGGNVFDHERGGASARLPARRAAGTAATTATGATRPWAVSSYGRAGRDRAGCREARARARASASPPAAARCCARRRRRTRCSASMSSSARSCSSRRSASWRSQSISADWRIASHITRDDCRSPPCASVVAASERSHHGAPGDVAGLLEPVAPPPGSRGAYQ